MEWWQVASLTFAGLLFLLFLGLPIGVSMGLVGAAGLLLARGPTMLSAIPATLHETVDNFVFIAIPLFVLLGTMVEAAGFGRDIYGSGQKWLGRLPGGLAIATAWSLAWFAAVSGSTVATAAAMGKIAMPEMVHHNYRGSLAAGTVAGCAIGSLIPPSIGMIVYGMMTETSVGALFMAGYGPGIMLAILFSVYIFIRARLDPTIAPRGEATTWREKLVSLKGVVPFLVIMLMISGSIYTGLATPTEAAAMSVFITVVVAAVYRRLTLRVYTAALMEALVITGMIVLLIGAAKVLSLFMALQGVAQGISAAITGLTTEPVLVVAGMMLVYFILGMLMDPIGMMVLTLPIFFPVITGLGVDPVLFGVLMIIQLELAVLTPPVAITFYIIAGMAEPYGISLGQVARGIFPFVGIKVLAIAILLALPQIALWLPGTMLK